LKKKNSRKNATPFSFVSRRDTWVARQRIQQAAAAAQTGGVRDSWVRYPPPAAAAAAGVRKRQLGFEFSLCLSRACLGRMMTFFAGKRAFCIAFSAFLSKTPPRMFTKTGSGQTEGRESTEKEGCVSAAASAGAAGAPGHV